MAAEQNTRNPEPKEIIGSRDLRDSFKETSRIRGSWFINGIELHQFEATSPASVVSQINAKSNAHFVTAEIDDQGHLVLIDKSGADIQIGQGAAFVEVPPAGTGDVGRDVVRHLDHEQKRRSEREEGNRVLELLGLQASDALAGTAPAQPGFETGRSAEDRRKERDQAAGRGPTAGPQIPSNPSPAGSEGSQGRLQDGRGRTGTGGGSGESLGRNVERR